MACPLVDQPSGRARSRLRVRPSVGSLLRFPSEGCGEVCREADLARRPRAHVRWDQLAAVALGRYRVRSSSRTVGDGAAGSRVRSASHRAFGADRSRERGAVPSGRASVSMETCRRHAVRSGPSRSGCPPSEISWSIVDGDGPPRTLSGPAPLVPNRFGNDSATSARHSSTRTTGRESST